MSQLRLVWSFMLLVSASSIASALLNPGVPLASIFFDAASLARWDSRLKRLLLWMPLPTALSLAVPRLSLFGAVLEPAIPQPVPSRGRRR